VTLDAASAGCCCEGFGVPYEQICDIWRACPSPPTVTVTYSLVVTDTLRMPDGSSWEEWRFQAGVPVPHTYAVSLGGTLTRGVDGVYRGTLSGSVTGGGEAPEYLSGSVTVSYPEGYTPGECEYGMPWYPDCDSVCQAFRLAEVRYQGSVSVDAEIRCYPWFIGGSTWDVGSGLWFVAKSGSGTVTTTYRCPDVNLPSNPTTEPWDASGMIPLQLDTPGNTASPFAYSRGCPPGTMWTSESTSETFVAFSQSVVGAFLRDTNEPPFFEAICEFDRVCGDAVATFTRELAVTVA
jgi:hypothetical protein